MAFLLPRGGCVFEGGFTFGASTFGFTTGGGGVIEFYFLG